MEPPTQTFYVNLTPTKTETRPVAKKACTLALPAAALLLLFIAAPDYNLQDQTQTINLQQLQRSQYLLLKNELQALVKTCDCAPILVRLAWHDAGTFNKTDGSGGSRAAQRFKWGESTDPANAGLNVARNILQPYKERFPNIGYADLWALAAVISIEHAGGPKIPFRAGRRDAKTVSDSVAHGRLPDGALGASHLRQVFGRMGFSDSDIVALSGAHTLGRCHADRSGFVGPWTSNPLTFDNSYFENLLGCDWHSTTTPTGKPQMACAAKPNLMMLNTDYALVTDLNFSKFVRLFAADQDAWFEAFSHAFETLIELGHDNLQDVFV